MDVEGLVIWFPVGAEGAFFEVQGNVEEIDCRFVRRVHSDVQAVLLEQCVELLSDGFYFPTTFFLVYS